MVTVARNRDAVVLFDNFEPRVKCPFWHKADIQPEDHRIEVRIGINVGDVIVDEGDIFGDGVNIAARIETLAMPGAICVSDNVYQQLKGKLTIDVVDMGEPQLKNIAQSCLWRAI